MDRIFETSNKAFVIDLDSISIIQRHEDVHHIYVKHTHLGSVTNPFHVDTDEGEEVIAAWKAYHALETKTRRTFRINPKAIDITEGDGC
jgi:hypothetical protein